METNKEVILQEMNEYRFSRKHIEKKIREVLKDPLIQKKLDQGTKLVKAWMSGDYYESKNQRIQHLQNLDIRELVEDLVVGIAFHTQEQLFTAVVAQIMGRLGFSNKAEAAMTTSEIVAVLCETDLFDITKGGTYESLYIVSNIVLPDNLLRYIGDSLTLPPMVCEPLTLTNNYDSGYLTHNDSLVLGAEKHHDGDLCLDVLNTINRVPLTLDVSFLSSLEEEMSEKLVTPEQKELAKEHIQQTKEICHLLAQQGNKLWFTNKVDSRGRIYSSGYHLNPQGTAYKKAMLEFFEEEIVEGVPE